MRIPDLTREQDFALEGRALQRMMPLLVWKDECEWADLKEYLSSFFDFTYVLFDVGLGRVSKDERMERGRIFHRRLDGSRLFRKKSFPAADGARLATDALGEPGKADFLRAPRGSQRDSMNPDVQAVVGNAASTLSNFGVNGEMIEIPARLDCEFIVERRHRTGVHVGTSFFARPLWPIRGSSQQVSGMPYPFLRFVEERWLESLEEVGLSGAAASYLGCLEGIHMHEKDQAPEAEEGSTVTINLGPGAVFSGPVAVGKENTASLRRTSGVEDAALRKSLETLVLEVNELLSAIDSDRRKHRLSGQLNAFVAEARKDTPSQSRLKTSAQGLLAAVKEAGPIVKSVETLVRTVLKLLGV